MFESEIAALNQAIAKAHEANTDAAVVRIKALRDCLVALKPLGDLPNNGTEDIGDILGTIRTVEWVLEGVAKGRNLNLAELEEVTVWADEAHKLLALVLMAFEGFGGDVLLPTQKEAIA